jgi:hypothetical protein
MKLKIVVLSLGLLAASTTMAGWLDSLGGAKSTTDTATQVAKTASEVSSKNSDDADDSKGSSDKSKKDKDSSEVTTKVVKAGADQGMKAMSSK